MRERGDGVLRISDRREIVQVGTALIKRADEFLAQHPDQTTAIRRLFTLRLAHVQRQGDPVRARLERNALDARGNDDDWALVESLAAPEWRLVVIGESNGTASAEVAHEVLLKTWPALRHWLELEREFLAWAGDVQYARKQYEAAPKRERRSALLMGRALAQAEQWLTARSGDIQSKEAEFIKTSARRARRFRALAAGVTMIALMGMTALGSAAWFAYRTTPEKIKLVGSLLMDADPIPNLFDPLIIKEIDRLFMHNGPTKFNVSYLSFVNAETKWVLDEEHLSTDIDAAADKAIQDLSQRDSKIVGQSRNLTRYARFQESGRLSEIYWHASLSRTEKIDLIINQLMRPNDTDGLVSGEFIEVDGRVVVRPYVLRRWAKNLVTDTRTFSLNEFYCPGPSGSRRKVLCPAARESIQKTVILLLQHL